MSVSAKVVTAGEAGQAPTTTALLARRLRAITWADLPPEAVTVAKQCLLDWLGVTLAARREPLVQILLEELAPEDHPTGVSILGVGRRAPLDTAVLINGAMSHALDFDDVIGVMGHPTAPVAPVVVALAEHLGASGPEALLAFIVGVEAECLVASLMGPSHYAAGWHGTATYGSFGAAMAAASLLKLDEDQLLHAFGLAGTQAAGLKSVFGTMSKPLHAGKAAQNGLLAARLARRGFTSDTDILGSPQGFAATQSTSVDPSAALRVRPHPYVADALFKYHAACYLTHNAIEAATALRLERGLTPEMIRAVTVRVHPVHMGVCNIEAPRTGLECKFSLRMTTAMALAGEDTFQDRLYSDETAKRADLVSLCRRTRVEATAQGPGSTVEVALTTGEVLAQAANVAEPLRDLERQQALLERKFRHLVEPVRGEPGVNELIRAVSRLDGTATVGDLPSLCAADAAGRG
jgi:2-methylcitrate dehydratase PrpD